MLFYGRASRLLARECVDVNRPLQFRLDDLRSSPVDQWLIDHELRRTDDARRRVAAGSRVTLSALACVWIGDDLCGWIVALQQAFVRPGAIVKPAEFVSGANAVWLNIGVLKLFDAGATILGDLQQAGTLTMEELKCEVGMAARVDGERISVPVLL